MSAAEGHQRSPSESDGSNTAIPVPIGAAQLPAGLDSGDVVLFNRSCRKMKIYAMLVCAAAKMVSNSRWDHVGMVVKHPDTGELLFLEADFGGVKLRSLAERVARSKSNEVAVRRLNIVRSDRDRRALFDFANEMLGTPYESAAGTMIKSVIDPLGKQERERMHALLLEKKAQLREINRELEEAALTLFQRRSLESERKRVAGAVAVIQIRLEEEIKRAHADVFEAVDDLSKVFCSELVAAAYQRLGLLETYPPAAGYNPKDFSSEQTNPPGVHLLRGARLSEEIFIKDQSFHFRKAGEAGSVASNKREKKDSEEDISQWLWPRRNKEPIKVRHAKISELNGVKAGDSPSRESRHTIREVLKRTPISSSITDEYKRAHLIKSFRAVILNPGDVVFHQGDYGDSFFIVESGRLERFIDKSYAQGGERGQPTLVTTLGPGTSCGMTAFSFNVPRTGTVRAVEPSLLWTVDRPTFEKLRDAGSDAGKVYARLDRRELRELIKNHFLFRNMDRIGPREVDAFFPVTFRAGDVIFSQGDRGENFFIIKSGEVERLVSHPKLINEKSDPKKNSQRKRKTEIAPNRDSALTENLVTTLGPGASFGELSLMYDVPRAATVRARTDVECWAINTESFHQLCLGGGTQYLKAVFNQYASVSRPNRVPGSDSAELKMMTGRDFLRFANIESLDIPNPKKRRIEALLLMLVTGNRHDFLDEEVDDLLLDFWEFVRFDILLNQPNAELQFAFRLMDRNNSGFVDFEEFQSLLNDYAEIDEHAQELLNDTDQKSRKLRERAFGKDGQRVIQYKEFCQLSKDILPPRFVEDIRFLMKHMLHDFEAPAQNDYEHGTGLHDVGDPLLGAQTRNSDYFARVKPGRTALAQIDSRSSGSKISHLICVVIAGVVSRCVVAPLERAKILMQTGAAARGVTLFQTFRWMIQNDRGSFLAGGFRGNGANILRIIPTALLQLLLVDQFRLVYELGSSVFKSTGLMKSSVSSSAQSLRNSGPTMAESIVLAGTAGMAATLITYPIDVIHARLSVQTNAFHPHRGVLDGLKGARRAFGPGSLYHGLVASMLGVFPYVGLSFATYEALRPMLPKLNDGSGHPTPGFAISCGVVSSLVAQAASYPLDTCRRCMQVQHLYQYLQQQNAGLRGTAAASESLSAAAGWEARAAVMSDSKGARAPLSMRATMRELLKEYGVRRLYRGWIPNFLKAFPVSMTGDATNVDWVGLHDRLQRMEGVAGMYGGSHAVYHAVAESRKGGKHLGSLRGEPQPHLKEWLVPPLKAHLDDPRTRVNWRKISSFDPYGMEAIRPTISATLASMDIPELRGELLSDGNIVDQNNMIHCVKVAIDPVWHIPSIAAKVQADERKLRQALFDWTQIPGVLDSANDVFLPQMGGTTVYCFGDFSAIHDNTRPVSSRPHDQCTGSDAFQTSICSCRPYLVHAIKHGVETAQKNGFGVIAYFAKEGRALGEVTKFRVYNLRRYQEGGDRPETYFEMTQKIAGVVDARAQELMPDVYHWLGIQKIDYLLSMSKDKYQAITECGRIHVVNRESLPEEMVPADAYVEISAKISSGYQGFQPRKTDENAERREVFKLETIRKRCKILHDLASENHELARFEIDRSKMDTTVSTVLNCMKRHYPDLQIPRHSRFRHFESGDIDRVGELSARWKRFNVDALERTRRYVDLCTVSVLLDAGAGLGWKYTDHSWGERTFSRSEGLAIASLDLFRNGSFSSCESEMRVDSMGLRSLHLSDLSLGFQVNEGNPLVGIEGRYEMLQRLALALENSPQFFGSPTGVFRPGNIVDYILKHSYSSSQRVSIRVLWQAVMDGLSSVFPDHSGLGVGDAYVHDGLVRLNKSSAPGYADMVPFHKLAQWLTYSLIEPLERLGVTFVDQWLLTGLAEYRNGGLLLDTKLLVPKNEAEVFGKTFAVDDPVIVEWRAITVSLLDKIAIEIWDRLGKTERVMPMAKILEGGTWRAGRELAFEKRPGGAPPIAIDSKGDVF
ncbi:Uracil catabolism protein 4 [Porphyridium purpureum]|uniref:Uracil catabolism protein 4 n=1 Tax=Porphyridium purpureum TaxID=35688 RepID=A0A5J4YXB7_PORPP|nr:Uracil catabolism protein 4 [Porphyridium purpureum]|eukprot:POR5571..scf209_3